MKYSIDAYHRYILPRYISPFGFRKLNSRGYHCDSLDVMFPRFPNCFLPFPLVFPHVSPNVSTVSFGISPVSYFRFCDLHSCGYVLLTRLARKTTSNITNSLFTLPWSWTLFHSIWFFFFFKPFNKYHPLQLTISIILLPPWE